MDELLAIAQKTMEGFNPATDKVDSYEQIADGVYNCLLEKVTARETSKGTPYISLDFSVMDENVHGHIFVPYYFSEKTLERSIKAVTKLAYEFGYELPADTFTDLESVAQALDSMSGNQAVVEIKTPTPKSENDKAFPNYKVQPVR